MKRFHFLGILLAICLFHQNVMAESYTIKYDPEPSLVFTGQFAVGFHPSLPENYCITSGNLLFVLNVWEVQPVSASINFQYSDVSYTEHLVVHVSDITSDEFASESPVIRQYNLDLPTAFRTGHFDLIMYGENGIEFREATLNYSIGSFAVPLPGAMWFLGSGLLGLIGWRKFRKS